MLIKFWGTRGSLPVSLNSSDVRAKVHEALAAASGRSFADDAAIERFMDDELPLTARHTWGGNSPCVELEGNDGDYVLCDMGSGLRAFGQKLAEGGGLSRPNTFHFFMSHLHWDHIMGFPLFAPAYVPGNRIFVYGCHDVLEHALRRQHSEPSFPVDFDLLPSEINFVKVDPDVTHEIAGYSISILRQDHSGDSFSFRFERDGTSVVYSTDAEHRLENADETQRVVDFYRGSDLVIFDSMYSLADATSVKADWGHSSNIVGVDLCHQAQVRHLCLFHHEPLQSDEAIYQVWRETIRYEELMREEHALEISSAFDGMEIVL
jgi:phosphoribosyl 1,2-cyclic phosphodiesterase